MSMLTGPYPYIRAWGKLLGSYRYYVDDQIARAQRDGAPQNAIYRDSNGHWHTFDDVTSASTRYTISQIMAEPEKYGM